MLRRIAAALAVAALSGSSAARAQDTTTTYLVVFDATWNASSHPTDFPPGPHFSPLVAGSHDAGVVFWEEGGIATDGIEMMAEVGNPFVLEGEVLAAIGAGHAHDVSIGGAPGSPGRANVFVEVSLAHPLATAVSMVAPSPDWFVGVAGIPLFVGGDWIDQVVYELHPYDAGSDAGPSFLSPDADLEPQVPISEITGFPFEGTPPLGTFTFVRTNPARSCANGLDDDGDGAIDFGGDIGCSDLDDASERAASLPCDDGADNDGDGRIDTADLGCKDAAAPTESPECSDGINNDPGQDSNVDFDGGVYATGVAVAPRDTYCQSPSQASERQPRACGLGFELVPVLIGTAWLLGRTARSTSRLRRGSRRERQPLSRKSRRW